MSKGDQKRHTTVSIDGYRCKRENDRKSPVLQAFQLGQLID